MRDKVIGKKWFYSDSERKHSPPTECGPSQRVNASAVNCSMVSFYRLGVFIC